MQKSIFTIRKLKTYELNYDSYVISSWVVCRLSCNFPLFASGFKIKLVAIQGRGMKNTQPLTL